MNVDIKINDVYLPYLFDYSNRLEIYYGGAGSGKSVFVVQKLVLKALKAPRHILVVRKVMSTIKGSCFAEIIKRLRAFEILVHCKVNKTTLEIELPNGSLITFKGMDDPEKVKSIEGITDIWCEEATELALDDFSQLNLRLRAMNPNLQMWLSFNPVSKVNWVYKHFFISKTDAFILKTTYKDNAFLPTSYKESIEAYKISRPDYYKIYVEGEFCSLDKLVYYNWETKDFDIAELIKTKKYTTITGLDFGFVNDPTALVVALASKEDKEIYIFEEYGKTGMLNEDTANVIKALGFSKNRIIADCASMQNVRELKKLGLTRIKGCEKKKPIIYGIQILQGYKIYILPSC